MKDRRRYAPVKRKYKEEGTMVLLNVGRALLARIIFIVHSIATIWQTAAIQEDNSVWGFALISLLIVFEGAHTIIMRAGDERRWFSPSILLYIIATAPPIWILEKKLCEKRATEDSSFNEEDFRLQLIEQLLLVVLIICRWLFPKGDISSEQLSQILLAYLAISSDIVEFFDVFKEKEVWSSSTVQNFMLSAWTLSLLQFPFVLTISRARKMRVAITKTYHELIIDNDEYQRKTCNVLYDVDIWAIILANALQDLPFLSVRLYLMLAQGLVTYTMIFFTCKNALIIVLQTYRNFRDRNFHVFLCPSHYARRLSG
ncbi:unnamed protein product [Dracunculus medinensis]|uniref:Transmembrane protein 26 n=1 Tax=Dracunculus medinensis TaxID=318479 RepID=A0A0N4UAQ0_DRAME|nr:unnamed protein product [Dracunculus medinensis]